MSGSTLLDSVSADATGTGICANQKHLVVYVWGTDFGGGTVTIQCSPDMGTTWFTCKHAADDDNATFISSEYVELQPIGNGAWIRAILSGATNPVDVSVKTLCC